MVIEYLNVEMSANDDRGEVHIDRIECHCQGWLSIGGYFSVDFIGYQRDGQCVVLIKSIWPLGKTEPLARNTPPAVWSAAQVAAEELCARLRAMQV